MRRVFALVPGTILVLSGSLARAQAPGGGHPGDIVAPAPPPPSASAPAAPAAKDEAPNALDAPNERRAGIVIGFGYGFGAAGASGYPNSASLINDPNYYSASDLMPGRGGSFYVMGALTDYLNFGVWFGAQTYETSHWRSVGGGGGFRVEAFPLYRLVPQLADLALFTQLGIGSTTLHNKLPGNYPSADGSQSFLGIGVLHEWSLFKMLGGHVAIAPTLEYDVTTSRSVERHGALMGGRVAFYGGI